MSRIGGGGAAEAAAAGGRAAAGGVEVGVGATLVAEGVGGAMNGIGVGAIDVPVVDAHAVSTVTAATAIKSRRTLIATLSRYGMECPVLIRD